MDQRSQPAGNYYDKYGTTNPIARRLMAGFLGAFDELSTASGARSALEVGCGEGELSIRLARRGLAVRGCDIAEEVLPTARERIRAAAVAVPVWQQDVYSLRPDQGDELVVCCEVLEHTDDPRRAVRVLAGLARPYVLASVPREPIWRVLNLCRGKYLGALGNTPGHVQHWSTRGFLDLLRTELDIVDVRAPLPWTMALCRTRTRT